MDGMEVNPSSVAQSVGRLLSGQLSTDIYQLVVATIIQVLGSGPVYQDDLIDGLTQVWPAFTIDQTDLEVCLRAAEEKGLVKHAVDDGGSTWRLDSLGGVEYDSTQTRRNDLFERLAHKIRIHAYDRCDLDLSLDECLSVAKKIENDLCCMIGTDISVFKGDVETNGELRPRCIDVPELTEPLSRGMLDRDDTTGLLTHSCLKRAADPRDPFGNELVSNIVKRYLIYSIITRHVLREDLAVLGAGDGTTLVLDTRALLEVISAPIHSDALVAALHTARRLRMGILIPPLVFKETQTLVESTRKPSRMELMEIRKAIGSKEDTDALDPMHVRFVAAQVAGVYQDWDEFVRASEPEAIRARLGDLDFDSSVPSGVSTAAVSECLHLLFTHLSAIHSARADNHESMETDAVTLAIARHLRKQRTDSIAKGKVGHSGWPASIILSPDRAFTPAMSQYPGDPNGWPYAMSIPAFIALFTQCRPTPDTGALLRDIGKLDSDEAKAIAVATQVSSNRAQHMAIRVSLGQNAGDVEYDRPDLSSIVRSDDYRPIAEVVEAAVRQVFIQTRECKARQKKHRLECIKDLEGHVTELRRRIERIESGKVADTDQLAIPEQPIVAEVARAATGSGAELMSAAQLMNTTLLTIHGLWSSPETWNRLGSVWSADEQLRGMVMKPFGYDTPKVPWMGKPGSRIPGLDDIARRLATAYSRDLKDCRNLAIVTHSQGGLVLQRFLAWMLQEGRGQELSRIISVIMLACPNNGTQYLGLLRKILGFGRRPQLVTLDVLNKEVAEAGRVVYNRIEKAAETNDSECRIPIHVYVGDSDDIVGRVTGEGVFEDINMLRGDHFSILDPRASGNTTAETVRDDILRDLPS